jgi:peroxiredoxin
MLLQGDLAPNFKVPSSVNPNFHFDSSAGRYIVLSFFATSTLPYSSELLAEVERRRERFDVTNAVFFGVSIDPEDPQRLKQQWPGVVYFWDLDRQVSKFYGLSRPTDTPTATRGGPAATTPGARAAAAEAATAASTEMREVLAAVQEESPATPASTSAAAVAESTADSPEAAEGAESATGGARGEVYRPCTFVLDQAMRVIAVLPFTGEPAAHLDEALNVLGSMPTVEAIKYPAPILLVPFVFEPELCRELIDHYLSHGGEDSGFMRDVRGKTVAVMDYSHKRRMDCEIADQDLINRTQERLARRLVPAIRQAFQFNVTRIERHIVACYDAADGGHFRAHRDNTTLGTAHRRFAVTLNLNSEEFEGGELCFPEFGRRRYKAPTGGAVVFSCSLLHEATPVSKGRRYAFLPFLYDDAAARIRERNRRFIADGPPIKGR